MMSRRQVNVPTFKTSRYFSSPSLFSSLTSGIQDDTKQKAVDQFLGNIEEDIHVDDLTPAEKWIQSQLNFRRHLFTTLTRKRMFIGTWNVNASVPDLSADLEPWLSPGVCKNWREETGRVMGSN